MLTLEEYIARRKKEDKLDEFNIDDRNDNMRICVNYVFEYFNNYLNIVAADEKTVLKNEKLDKYRQQFKDYDQDVIEWLVNIYSEYGKQINKYIANTSNEDEFFLLYDSDKEFRGLSYDCYSQLIRKLPFLKDQTEMLFLFIKNYHWVVSHRAMENQSIYISDDINEWINETWKKYQVNLIEFTYRAVERFYDNEDIWPVSHRQKSKKGYRKYEYDIRQKSNLFNIDSLYRKMPKKAFVKGRKQELEILMMYHWLHSLDGDDTNYWDEYLGKVLFSLKERSIQ